MRSFVSASLFFSSFSCGRDIPFLSLRYSVESLVFNLKIAKSRGDCRCFRLSLEIPRVLKISNGSSLVRRTCSEAPVKLRLFWFFGLVAFVWFKLCVATALQGSYCFEAVGGCNISSDVSQWLLDSVAIIKPVAWYYHLQNIISVPIDGLSLTGSNFQHFDLIAMVIGLHQW